MRNLLRKKQPNSVRSLGFHVYFNDWRLALTGSAFNFDQYVFCAILTVILYDTEIQLTHLSRCQQGRSIS